MSPSPTFSSTREKTVLNSNLFAPTSPYLYRSSEDVPSTENLRYTRHTYHGDDGSKVRVLSLPVLCNRTWRGGRNYSLNMWSEYEPTNSWEWTHDLGWDMRLNVRAYAYKDYGRGRRVYAASIELRLKNRSILVERKKSLQSQRAILAWADTVRCNELNPHVEELLKKVYDRGQCRCVYRLDREKGAWVPFCTDYNLDWVNGLSKRLRHARQGDLFVVVQQNPTWHDELVTTVAFLSLWGSGWSFGGIDKGHDPPDPVDWVHNDVEEIGTVPVVPRGVDK